MADRLKTAEQCLEATMAQFLMVILMPLFLIQSPNTSSSPNQPGLEPQQRLEQEIEQQVSDQVNRRRATTLRALNGILVPLGLFTMVGFIVRLKVRHNQAMAESRIALQRQVLEKFTSGREFAEFLESKGGQQFLNAAWSPRMDDRMQRSLRIGLVTTLVGVALLMLSFYKHQLVIGGGVSLAIGLAYLISAALSYRLSKQIGRGNGSSTDQPVTRL